jgi:threonine dehydratase
MTHDGLAAEVEAAERRIRAFVLETPVLPSHALGDRLQAAVFLKCENQQRTGSFKLRGATNHLMCLPADGRGRGVIAASSGNHGIAVAQAGRALGVRAIVYVPEGASPAKLSAMRRLGADVRTAGADGLDTEQEARRVAEVEGLPYVSPYNDVAVVAGQGTVAVEIRRQVPDLEAVIVAVGGGGLIGGMAVDLKQHLPGVRVIGAVPANSPVMAASVRAGRILEMPTRPTLSDGTAGGIETGSITFPLCRDLVDEWVEVDEDDIGRAMRHCVEEEHVLVEGSAGVAVAASWRLAQALRGSRVAVVLCGANVTAERLRSVL